jgi:general stress protein 26
MVNIESLNRKGAIEKLKNMIGDIKFCFFKTKLENENSNATTIMTAQSVDKEGNIWFFSGKNSERNKDIEANEKVQLYFSCPEKNTYLSIHADANIVLDKNKIIELWNPSMKIWFKDGLDDKNISLIKATTKTANYWDSEGQKMINLFKTIKDIIKP